MITQSHIWRWGAGCVSAGFALLRSTNQAPTVMSLCEAQHCSLWYPLVKAHDAYTGAEQSRRHDGSGLRAPTAVTVTEGDVAVKGSILLNVTNLGGSPGRDVR